MAQEISQIKEIQFSISSPEDILKSSAAHINNPTLYDTTSNNIPKTGGLFDTRLGVIDRQFRCKTCEQTHVNCPGHMGHIENEECDLLAKNAASSNDLIIDENFELKELSNER